jgi:malate dehydrogenase (quinone)
VVSSADGTIASLLGASPGASTAVPIMLGLIEKCFPDRIEAWKPELQRMIPSYGTQLSADPELAAATIARTAGVLQIHV